MADFSEFGNCTRDLLHFLHCNYQLLQSPSMEESVNAEDTLTRVVEALCDRDVEAGISHLLRSAIDACLQQRIYKRS